MIQGQSPLAGFEAAQRRHIDAGPCWRPLPASARAGCAVRVGAAGRGGRRCRLARFLPAWQMSLATRSARLQAGGMNETMTRTTRNIGSSTTASATSVWSGRVNVRLAEVASRCRRERALDLGCGEGGDAMWLAEHGWHVTAVDISETALQRAAARARSRNRRTASSSPSTICRTLSPTARST